MSKKRLMRGIKRITIFLTAAITIGVLSFNWMSEKVKYPEFTSSQAAYHAVYGDNRERLEILDAKAQEMGYESFNDYRVRTW